MIKIVRVKLDTLLEGNLPYYSKKIEKVVHLAVKKTLEYEGMYRTFSVSLLLTDNEHIKEINRETRNIDRATDVLSFPQYEPHTIEPLGKECILLGDIVISCERADEQAKELEHGFLREVAFLAIHSTLHLLGYDHMEPQEEEEMCHKQQQIIKQVEKCRYLKNE